MLTSICLIIIMITHILLDKKISDRVKKSQRGSIENRTLVSIIHQE